MSNGKERLPKESIVEIILSRASESALAKATEGTDGKPDLSIENVLKGYVTLKEAKESLGVAWVQYVRRILKEGALEGIRVSVAGGTRWLVTRESIERYRATRKERSSKRNYILKIDSEEEEEVRKALEEAGIEYELSLSYVKKEGATAIEETIWAKVIKNLEG